MWLGPSLMLSGKYWIPAACNDVAISDVTPHNSLFHEVHSAY